MICQCESCDLRTLFYSSIGIEDVDKYCASRREVNLSAGEDLIKQGDVIKDFIYLKEGLVKLYRDIDHGQTQIISFGRPYDCKPAFCFFR